VGGLEESKSDKMASLPLTKLQNTKKLNQKKKALLLYR